MQKLFIRICFSPFNDGRSKNQIHATSSGSLILLGSTVVKERRPQPTGQQHRETLEGKATYRCHSITPKTDPGGVWTKASHNEMTPTLQNEFLLIPGTHCLGDVLWRPNDSFLLKYIKTFLCPHFNKILFTTWVLYDQGKFWKLLKKLGRSELL